ncbi:MAG: 30S ribosomal protein S2 [Candidatus Omnitrophota bacterium]
MAMRSKVIKELLENGVHFGHQTNKWNPKMGKFIFGEKSGIYIIDLKKTEEALQAAENFLTELTGTGKTVLFVGTKKQAKQIIKDEALRCGMFFVNERWLGGCLTNFATIRKSVEKLNQIQEMKESGIYESLSKKEKSQRDKQENKLLKNLEGIRNMTELPQCMIVIDAEAEDIAIKEARIIGIPVIALIDTNCNPDLIEFPIPGNDDAIRAIKYIVSTLANAVETGKKGTVTKPEVGEDVPVKSAEEDLEKKEEIAASPKVEEVAEKKEEIVLPPKVEEVPEKKKETIAPLKVEEVLEGDIKLDDKAE